MTSPTEQPMPTPNEERDIQSLVISDIVTRRAVGIQRYGTALQPNNGRDALRDAYEEALDLAMYLRQAIEERDLAERRFLADPDFERALRQLMRSNPKLLENWIRQRERITHRPFLR